MTRAPIWAARTLLVTTIAACGPPASAPATNHVVRQEFQFQILDFKTPRQDGRTLNLVVRYRYRDDLPTKDYPDYRVVREEMIEFLKVRAAEPADEYWEKLNGDLVRHLMKSFRFAGLSSMIQVHPDPNPKLEEPGWHSSIATVGDIAPLVVP